MYKVEADDTTAVLSGTVSGESGVFAITVPASFTLIPGSVRLSVNAYDSNNQLLSSIYSGTAGKENGVDNTVRPSYTFIGGAVVNADEVTSDMPKPDDFADFWAEQLANLPDPTGRVNSTSERKYRNGFAIYKMDADYLTKLGYETLIPKLATHDIYEIFLRCDLDSKNGRPSVGYVSVPKNAAANSLKISVGLNAYGARDGYISCGSTIMVKMHPCGLPKAYYNVDDGTWRTTDFSTESGFALHVADYDDPANAYLCAMLLRNVQMLRFLTDETYDYETPNTTNMTEDDLTAFQTLRDAYNGEIEFVYGGSMGGFQNVGTAALCMLEVNGERVVKGEISSIVVGCPWMCDPIAASGVTGRLKGLGTRIGTVKGDSLADLNLAGLSYFDTVHFGSLLTEGKIEIQAGYADTTCPSSGMVALYNAIGIEKKMIFSQNKDHSGKDPSTMFSVTYTYTPNAEE